MLTIDMLSRMSDSNKKQIYKQCFYSFIEDKNTYRPVYNVANFQIERRQFLLFVETYHNLYASYEEKLLYKSVINLKKNNKFEKLKNRYHEAFIMYLKNEDTDEFYESLAQESRVSIDTAKRYPFHYYDKYASDEEREIFDQVKLEKKEENETQKEQENIEKLKYMFDACVNSNFDDEKIDKLTEKFSISPQTVKNYINNYYDRYANDYEKEQYNIAKEKQKENNARYVKIFNHILKMNKTEDILLYLVQQKNLNRTYLKTSINPYLMSYPEADGERLTRIVETYYNYISYRNKKDEISKQKIEETNKKIEQEKQIVQTKIEKQKKLILELIKLVKNYNNSEYKSYIDYCNEKEINLKNFEYALKLTAKLDKKIYSDFINKTRIQNRKKYTEEYDALSALIAGLKENEKFGILDYYDITKMNLDELNIIAKKVCERSDYQIFERFYEKYHSDKTINPATLLKASYLINSYGSQIELNDKTRAKIIADLKEQEIPITKNTYLEGIKRTIEQSINKQKLKVG